MAGRYRVEGLLGEGGAGEVYSALDQELERRVAVKVLRREFTDSAEAVARLRRETAIAQTVTHRSVCRIYDVRLGEVSSPPGSSPDRDRNPAARELHFVSMELLEGENLAEFVGRRGPLGPAAALRVGQQIGEGLLAAHRAGVVHRDVKPSNVMMVPEAAAGGGGGISYRAVITDFGLSESTAEEWPDPSEGAPELGVEPVAKRSGAESRLEGVQPISSPMAGTPLCLAPEQVVGGAITPAVDVYSYGVLLYFVLTASWPFLGRSRIAVAMARLDEEPIPLTAHAPALAAEAELVQLVADCMQRSPEDRPAGFEQILARLESARPHRSGRTSRSGVLSAAAVVVLLAAGAYVLGGRFLQPPPGTASAVTSPVAVSGTAPPMPVAFAESTSRPHPGVFTDAPQARERYLAALAALRESDPMGALNALEDALEMGGEHPIALRELSRAWALAGNSQEALEAAQRAQALAEGLERGEQLSVEAQLRIAESDWPRAVDVFKALWEFFPEENRYGYELAGMLDRTGRLDEAKETITRLRLRMEGQNAHVDLREALIEYHRGDYERSAALAREAASNARAVDSRILEAVALGTEALTRSVTDQDLAEVSELLQRAKATFEEVGHQPKVAAVTRRMGQVARRQGRLDDAEAHYRAARRIAQQIGDPATLAGASGDLAVLLDGRGEVRESVELRRAVLASYQRRGIRQGVAIASENLGISLLKLGEPELAMERMLDAESMYEELGDQIGRAWAPYHQGRVWLAMGQPDLAKKSFDVATSLAEGLGDDILLSYICFERSEGLSHIGQLEQAWRTNRRCAEQYRSRDLLTELAAADLQAGRISLAQAEVDRAAGHAQRAFDYFSEQGLRSYRLAALELLVELDAESGSPRLADRLSSFDALVQSEQTANRLSAAATQLFARQLLSGRDDASAAVRELDALRQQAQESGLVPVALDMGVKRLRLAFDGSLATELRELARERGLDAWLSKIPAVTGAGTALP